MSIRVLLVFVYVAVLSFYAWRRKWFLAACGAVLLTAFAQHEDFPRTMGGIPGLNPLNFLIANAFLAWLVQRGSMGMVWDLPRRMQVLGGLFLAVVIISTLRLLFDVDGYTSQVVVDDPGAYEKPTWGYFFNDYFLNTFKYFMPAVMIYDGCRTRREAVIALVCLLGMFFLLALQVIRCMPISAVALSGDDLARVAARQLVRRIGFSHVTLSMLLAGASWAAVALLPLAAKRSQRLLILAVAGTIAFGQALTGGRMGYLTFGMVGLILCGLRWKRYLFAIPLAVVVVVLFVPAVKERMLKGLVKSHGPVRQQYDSDFISSGRFTVWPVIIKEIGRSPWVGYGRGGIVRSGAHRDISENIYGQSDFMQPHNAYLEMLLDAGILGSLFVFWFYLAIQSQALRVFLDRRDPLLAAAGGVGSALLLALLVASVGSQTLYPTNQAIGLWTGLAIMMRVSVERTKMGAGAASFFGEGQAAEPEPAPAQASWIS